jgi:Rrf2 family iron-sulfur cluster assembly transcriptional regulator
VDESVDATSCGGVSSCQGDVRCLTHDLWTDLSQQIQNFLGGISLQDLMDKKRRAGSFHAARCDCIAAY